MRWRGEGQPVLLYPVSCELSGGGDDRGSSDLGALVGRTRATMLGLLAGCGGTTSELARRTGVSLAPTSQHAGVLREAWLITTQTVGRARFHALTPLGSALLRGSDRSGPALNGRAVSPRDQGPTVVPDRSNHDDRPLIGVCFAPVVCGRPYELVAPARRLPSFKRQRNTAGLSWSSTMDRHVRYESWLESDVAMTVDFEPDAVGRASHPFWLSAG